MIHIQVTVVILLGTLTHFVKCNTRVNLSCAQIRAFVDGHNFRRWTVAQGLALGQPAAADMLYMRAGGLKFFAWNDNHAGNYVPTLAAIFEGDQVKDDVWDEELAEKAARWAEHGVFSHNPDKTIGSLRWPLVGENIFYSKFWSTLDIPVIPNIEEALNSWYMEHFDYGFYPFVLGTKKTIGHYTQMVWANSNRLGCGISQKKENGETFTLFVCNYGPTGNYIGQLPYTSSKFPGYLHCKDGQCAKLYGYMCSY